jgi:hypothetical protein
MQRQVASESGAVGITTTDDFILHEPGCVSVSHPGYSCEEAMTLFRKGKFSGTGGRGFRPVIFRKASTGPR